MEISSLLNSLLGRHSSVRQEAPTPISGTELLRSGTTLLATVEKVIDLTATQKQALLNRINQELSQLKTNATPPEQAETRQVSGPVTNPAPSSIGAARLALAALARLELLTAPRILLAEIRLPGDTHLVYTNRPLSTGDQILIKVRTDGQLQLLDPPPTKATAKIVTSEPLSANRLATPETNQLIAQGLRRYLPQGGPAVELHKIANALVVALKTVPEVSRPMLLPEPVWKILAQISQRAVAPEQLQKPEAVQFVLRNSGHFLESRLGELVRQHAFSQTSSPQSSSPQSSSPQSSSPPSTSLPPGQLLKSPGMDTTKTTPAKTTPAELPPGPGERNGRQAASIQPILDKDQKALLLSLAKELSQAPPAVTINSAPIKSSGPDLFSLFAILFNQLGRGLTPRQTIAENRQQLIALLQTRVATSIARIQTQQLQHLMHHLNQAGADNPTAPTGGMFEIPVRINENIFPLFIHIQEKFAREKAEEEGAGNKKNQARKKGRRWQVFMEFDLDDLGWFASEISTCDHKVKTLFWAENTDTRNRAREKLEELKEKLQQSGIEVEEIRCLEGEPPKRPVKIQHSLVDITT